MRRAVGDDEPVLDEDCSFSVGDGSVHPVGQALHVNPTGVDPRHQAACSIRPDDLIG